MIGTLIFFGLLLVGGLVTLLVIHFNRKANNQKIIDDNHPPIFKESSNLINIDRLVSPVEKVVGEIYNNYLKCNNIAAHEDALYVYEDKKAKAYAYFKNSVASRDYFVSSRNHQQNAFQYRETARSFDPQKLLVFDKFASRINKAVFNLPISRTMLSFIDYVTKGQIQTGEMYQDILVFFASFYIVINPNYQTIKSYNYASVSVSYESRYEQRNAQNFEAPVAYKRWLHQNANGGPDRRYSVNYSTSYVEVYDVTVKFPSFEINKTLYTTEKRDNYINDINKAVSVCKVAASNKDEALDEEEIAYQLLVEESKPFIDTFGADQLYTIKIRAPKKIAIPPYITSYWEGIGYLGVFDLVYLSPTAKEVKKLPTGGVTKYAYPKNTTMTITFGEKMLTNIRYETYGKGRNKKIYKEEDNCVDLTTFILPKKCVIESGAFANTCNLYSLYEDPMLSCTLILTKEMKVAPDAFNGTHIRQLKIETNSPQFIKCEEPGTAFTSISVPRTVNADSLEEIFKYFPNCECFYSERNDSLRYTNKRTIRLKCPDNIQTLYLPICVSEIGKDSFSVRTNIETLSIPNEIKKIDKDAFHNIRKKAEISLPQRFKGFIDEPDNITFTYNSDAFKTQDEIILNKKNKDVKDIIQFAKKIIVEEDVPNLKELFSEAIRLEEIDFKEGITKLDSRLFYQNNSVQKVILSSSVKEVGDECFMDASSLEEINGFDQVTQIGKKCFYNANKLKNIVLNDEIKELGDECFYNCSSLKTIKAKNVKKVSKLTLI